MEAEGEKKGAMEAEKGEKEAMAAAEGEKKGAMAAAAGEKKGAMEAGKGEKEAMAADKGAPVEEKRKGEGGAVASEEEKGEAASEKGEAVAEAKEVAGMKRITVKCLDGEERSMSVVTAQLLSGVLSDMNEGNCEDDVISLARVATARTLDTVVEYCTKHAAEPVKSDCDPRAAAGSSSSSVDAVNTAASKDLEECDRKLVKGLNGENVHNLLFGVTYLSIEGLDVVCEKTAANMIKFPNDLTPEDLAELRQQYALCFDDEE